MCFPRCLFGQLDKTTKLAVAGMNLMACAMFTGMLGPQGCPSGHWCDLCSLLLFSGYEETLMRLAAILAKHFADSRIVGTGKAALLCSGVMMFQVWLVPLLVAHQTSVGIYLLNLLSALCLHVQREAGHCPCLVCPAYSSVRYMTWGTLLRAGLTYQLLASQIWG